MSGQSLEPYQDARGAVDIFLQSSTTKVTAMSHYSLNNSSSPTSLLPSGHTSSQPASLSSRSVGATV